MPCYGFRQTKKELKLPGGAGTKKWRLLATQPVPAAASEAAAQIIAWAAREHPGWFWRGVRLPDVRVFCLDP